MNVIDDMSTSGCLDDTEEVKMQFSDHFSPVQHGGSSPKWVARFCKAYVAHVLMGVRATIDSARREAAGELVNSVWPAKRTVLVRAENGVATQSYAEGVSRVFDLDGFVSNVELYELQGTHFGILNPDSGLSEILDTVVRS
jgi:hypothetical protein